MKYTFTFILAILFAGAVFSQNKIGIYRTYKDFEKGKIESYESYDGLSKGFTSFKVRFTDKAGKQHKFELDEKQIWGYVKDNNTLVRVHPNGAPFVVITVGEIVAYGNYSTSVDEDGTASMSTDAGSAVFSLGLNGKMEKLVKRNLLDAIPEDSPYYEEAKNCRIFLTDLVDFIRYYNHEMEKKGENGTMSKN